ncbi:MAG: class I SAM-dependent methyltransferase [Myxococcota bacterium]
MSSGSWALADEVKDYLVAMGVREASALAELRIATADLEQSGMQISPEQGAFMQMIVRLTGARQILELGTFTGYSALAMALALPSDGHITCLDTSEEWTTMARQHWQEAGVGDRITLHLGPALDTLDQWLAEGRTNAFDLAFVDADKANLLAYHERCLPLLKPGGAILYDNVLWGGSVVDSSNQKPSTEAIRALNRTLHADERVDIVMVPVGDGLTIARKR